MVDAGELGFEHLADACDVAEGEVAVVELLLLYLAVDDVVDEAVHVLLVVGLEALAGGFDAVDYHHYGCLGGEGCGACISESRGVNLLGGMGLFLLGIEVAGIGGAVMGADEVDDDAGQMVLACEVDAVGDVLRDDAGALFVVELVVWVEVAALVLGEVERGTHLADVVIEGSDACEERVAANLTHDVLADVGDLHRMLESARCVARELTQGGSVGGGYLHEGEVGYKSEHALEDEDEGVGQEGEESIEEEDEVAHGVDGGDGGELTEYAAGVDEGIGEEDDEAYDEEVASFLEIADGDDAHHTSYELIEDELEGIGHHVADDDDGGEVDVEGDTHVEEDTHEYWSDAEGHDENPILVDMQHESRDRDHKEDDEEDEGDLEVVLENLVPRDLEEHVERHEGNEAEEEEARIAADGSVGGLEAEVALGFEGGDYLSGLDGDGFAFGDDELPFADHIGGDLVAREPGVELELSAHVVVGDAGDEDAVGEPDVPKVGTTDEVGHAELRARVATQENEGVGLDVGEVGGFFNIADAVDAVDEAVQAAGFGLREIVAREVGGEALTSEAGCGAVDRIVEKRVGASLAASFLNLRLRAVDGEVEGSIEVVVAPDAAYGIVVTEERLSVGEEEQDEDYGDEESRYLVDGRHASLDVLKKSMHTFCVGNKMQKYDFIFYLAKVMRYRGGIMSQLGLWKQAGFL